MSSLPFSHCRCNTLISVAVDSFYVVQRWTLTRKKGCLGSSLPPRGQPFKCSRHTQSTQGSVWTMTPPMQSLSLHMYWQTASIALTLSVNSWSWWEGVLDFVSFSPLVPLSISFHPSQGEVKKLQQLGSGFGSNEVGGQTLLLSSLSALNNFIEIVKKNSERDQTGRVSEKHRHVMMMKHMFFDTIDRGMLLF